jgi:class 3 adenylate cyclase
MPMFLDRHDMAGASVEDIASAHVLDVETQARFGVKYHTYWFDPADGTVFCLAEGPSKEAVDQVHREAHGAMASSIIELDAEAPLNTMLGTWPAHPVGTAYAEPALRAIVFTDMCGSVAQTQALGDEGHLKLLRQHNDIVRAELAAHGGREVKHTGDGIMASFNSVASAVAFSVAVQRRVDEFNAAADAPFHISIGVSAGEPVTDDNDDLFGAAVQLAARLCAHAEPGDIVASLAVRELCIGKQFTFEDRGSVELKGIPDPTPTFAVAWRGELA